jgi:hypothetical protein
MKVALTGFSQTEITESPAIVHAELDRKVEPEILEKIIWSSIHQLTYEYLERMENI